MYRTRNSNSINKQNEEFERLLKVEHDSNQKIAKLEKRLRSKAVVQNFLEKKYERLRCQSLRAMDEIQIAFLKFEDDKLTDPLVDEVLRIMNGVSFYLMNI